LPFARKGGGVEAYEYRLNLHPIVVRSISFPGVVRDELPALNSAAKPLLGEDYLRTHLRAQEELNFLPVYRARGYLKAQFADPEPKVVEDGAQTLVDVGFPVMPGQQYQFTDLEIVGNTALPAEKLRERIHLRKGEPADAVQLTSDFDEIHKLYGTKGYIFARVDPVATIDDLKATVSYLLKVTEGDLYRMGDLTMDGIPRENADRILAQWQMKKGDPFDESYCDKFFTILYRDFRLHQSYDITSKRMIDQQAKTVSLSLHFVPKG
jgi:outer membrane protein insertion porin family